jgi:glycosyltransferase involved in cell wall biosynthesis
MQHLLRERFGVDSLVISNGANTSLFHPISKSMREEIRTELGVREGEFCLCYLGSIENWLDLEPIVEALVRLDSLRLIMIGGSPRSISYLNDVQAICETKGVKDRVTLTGFKDQAEAARILASCDAAIIPFPLRRELSAVALPDKTFEYLASGVPVISTRLPDLVKLFGNLIYFYDTVDELIGILQLLNSNTRNNHTSDRVIAAAKYDWNKISVNYEKLIVELVAGKKKRETEGTGLLNQ